MARRGGKYLLARRIADRGNDTSVFYSRTHGEDRRSTRRITDRGSDGVFPDPWDLKIRRLRQRVRDLEIQQEIKRLRKRVRDLELQRERRVTETESDTVFWDEGDDGEEHPLDYPHPQFLKPIYKDESDQECVWEDEPKFDEDENDFEDEECLFVRRALSGITFHEDRQDERVVRGKIMPTVVAGGTTVATCCGSVNSSDRDSSDGVRLALETETNSTKVSGFARVSAGNLDDHLKSILIGRSRYSSSLKGNTKFSIAKEVGSSVPLNMDSKNLLNINCNTQGKKSHVSRFGWSGETILKRGSTMQSGSNGMDLKKVWDLNIIPNLVEVQNGMDKYFGENFAENINYNLNDCLTSLQKNKPPGPSSTNDLNVNAIGDLVVHDSQLNNNGQGLSTSLNGLQFQTEPTWGWVLGLVPTIKQQLIMVRLTNWIMIQIITKKLAQEILDGTNPERSKLNL